VKISRFQAFSKKRGQIRDSRFSLYASEDLVYPHSQGISSLLNSLTKQLAGDSVHQTHPGAISTYLLSEAYAQLDRTLRMLVDLTVRLDGVFKRYDWRHDPLCSQAARREPAQSYVNQPFQRPGRGVAQRQALHAGRD
jgi:hypothetical protein